jgi:hypothetical protein
MVMARIAIALVPELATLAPFGAGELGRDRMLPPRPKAMNRLGRDMATVRTSGERPLNILTLEDAARDAELTERELRGAPVRVCGVESRCCFSPLPRRRIGLSHFWLSP